MKNIKRLLDQLAQQADMIITSPEQIETFSQQGVPVHESPESTLEERLDTIFKTIKELAPQIAPRLAVTPVGHPSIASLYTEIKACIMFALNGAAITLCGILVEYALKYAAYAREVGGVKRYDAKLWDRYEKKTFGSAIRAADGAGLLTDDLKKRLRSFKKDVRDPYAHYNIKKITKDVVWGKVKIAKVDTGEVHEKDVPAVESPVIQAQAKPLVDAHQVLDVFSFADEVVRHLLKQIEA